MFNNLNYISTGRECIYYNMIFKRQTYVFFSSKFCISMCEMANITFCTMTSLSKVLANLSFVQKTNSLGFRSSFTTSWCMNWKFTRFRRCFYLIIWCLILNRNSVFTLGVICLQKSTHF